MKTIEPMTAAAILASNTAPAAMSSAGQVRSLVSGSKPLKSVSMALLKSSLTSTIAMQPRRMHQSITSQCRTIAAAMTRAVKKKWTKKLEWPRMPSFKPLKAARNLLRQDRRGRTVGIKVRLDDFSTHTRARTLPTAVNEPDRVTEVALELLREFSPPRPVRLLGVRVAAFEAAEGEQAPQLALPV